MKVEKLNKETKVKAEPESEKEKAIFSAVAETEYKVKDDRGRTITMRRPSPRMEIYFPTLFNRDDSMNLPFMMSIKPFAYVRYINEVKIETLLKKSDLDALIDMLGHDGRKAIQVGYAKYFAMDDIKDQQEIDEEIKKLL